MDRHRLLDPCHSPHGDAANSRKAVERGPMTSVLYDLPGPRARVRNRILGVLATVGIVALAGFIVYRFWVTGQFEGRKWEWLLYKDLQLQLVDALGATIRAFAVGALLALAFGF